MIEPLLRAEARRAYGLAEEEWRVLQAPYRFCPLGAHVDHQGGEVTGFALDRSVHVAFVVSQTPEVRVRSLDAPSEVRFSIDAVPDPIAGDWGNYVRGAARALARHAPIERGITGVFGGEMQPGGVSSSAALGVACLLALEAANGLTLSRGENVELDRQIENDYVGLRNGILDPSIVLGARAGELLHVDCATGATESFARPASSGDLAFLAVHSGLRSALVATSFNDRVRECEEAAADLIRATGASVPHAPRLAWVPPDVFTAHAHVLGPVHRRRALHFYSEQARVRRGIEAWRQGDLELFGSLVTETYRSSVANYECGSPELVALVEALLAEDGVYGARFSGGGYRGYAVALLDPARAPAIEAGARDRYLRAYPEHERHVHAHLCRSAAGAS